MSLIGKLFGSITGASQREDHVSVTARPGYGDWYARQMAQSYARRRAPSPVVQLFPAADCALPLAA